jgi:hypothetical protein
VQASSSWHAGVSLCVSISSSTNTMQGGGLAGELAEDSSHPARS